MPLGKRKSLSYNYRAKRARMRGTMTSGARKVRSRAMYRPAFKYTIKRVNALYKMIETKENTRSSAANVALPHNNVYVVQASNGVVFDIFRQDQGVGDPMQGNFGNRIGDQINVKGVMLKGFVENALGRPKVFYRIMLLRGAKGETFSRDTIFKGDSGNRMIDQVNTERFSVIAQKVFTVSASNVAASGAEVVNGAPLIATAGGVGTRTFKFWIPGSKFGRNGHIQYENGAVNQVKFFDYRVVMLVYDWYGTPQDVNNVGRLNEMYSKLYFKDA